MRPAGYGPHFLGIGAVKSGTTWLHRNLQAHPGVWMPPVKELRYFDQPEWNPAGRLFPPRLHALLPPSHRPRDPRRYEHWRRELARVLRTPRCWLGPRRAAWHATYFLGRRSPDWYRRLFAPAGDRLAGEVSPLYALLSAAEVDLVRQRLPHLKAIYLLRDPVDRTWSHLQLRCLGLAGWRREGVTPELVEETFRRRDLHDARLWRNNDYAAVLERWEARFGSERVGVFFHDDLVADPPDLLQRILRFLELPASGAPPVRAARRRHHATPRPLPLPPGIGREIARRSVPGLEDLARRFAGIHPAPEGWLRRARHLASGSTDADRRSPSGGSRRELHG